LAAVADVDLDKQIRWRINRDVDMADVAYAAFGVDVIGLVCFKPFSFL
jgi:hypothetical protein